MKKRTSRIIAMMLVLVMVICNQSYSSWASDRNDIVSEGAEIASDESGAEQSEIATDSDAWQETDNEVLSEETYESFDEGISDAEDMADESEVSAESEASDEGKDEQDYPAFIRSESVDGVRVTFTAAEGVFPEGAVLSVEKASDIEKQQIEQAVNAVRDDSVNVAETYTFDIKVLDESGNEIQPADGQTVNVSFAMDEVSNQNLNADVYHVPEEDGSLVAEELNATESGNTVTAVSDGFSYYTVEFTYDEKQYVMQGDTTVALVDILSYVGITKADGSAATDSDIVSVSVSDESLFSASNESGEWVVTAHQAFTSTEWMKVTVDGVEYEIVVTDAISYGDNSIPSGITLTDGGKLNVLYYNGNTNAYLGKYVMDSTRQSDGGTIYMGYYFSRNTMINNFNSSTYKSQGYTYGNEASYFKVNSSYQAEGVMSYYNSEYYGTFMNNVTTGHYLVMKINIYPSTCTVTYDTNAGSDSVTGLTSTTATVDKGSSTTLPTLTRIGYTLNGWYTAVSDGTKVGNGGESYTPSSNITLYAQWIPNAVAPVLTGWSGTYDGNAHSVTASGASGGTVNYRTSTDGSTWGSWSTTVPSRIDAGTTYVQAITKGDSTHSDSSVTTSVQITIDPKTVTNGIQAISNQTYTGSNITPSITVKDGNTVIAATEYNVSYSNNKDVGTATVTVSDKTGGNYTVSGSTTFTITKAPLTITANDKTITYGDAPASNGVSYGGFLGTDSDSVLNGDLTYSYTYTQNQDAGEYAITPGGVTAANYDVTFVDGKLIVNPKSVNIPQLSDNEKVYNGEYLSPTVSAYDNALITQDGVVSAKGTGSYLVYWSLNNTTNYKWSDNSITDKNATWSISPKNITVTADDKSKIFGEEDPEFTYSVSENGIVGSDTLSNINLSREAGNNVGTYAINANQSDGSNPNYNITFVQGTLTIGTKNITPEVTLSQDTFTYNRGQQTPTVYVRYNGTDMNTSDYEVLYSTDGNNFTTTIDSKNKGTYYIKVVAKDSGNYNFDSITETYTINPKPIDASMVTLTDERYVYDGNEKQPVVTVKDGSVLSNNTEYEIDASSTASATNYGTYHIVVNGIGNYTGSYTAVWSITKKDIEGVTINSVETTYDGEPHKLDVTIPDNATITYGIIPGEYVLPGNPGVKDAGVHTIYYKVEIDDNYETIEGSKNVVINPKAITLTTADKTMTYGETDPTFGYTVEGMVGDDILEGITFSREAGEDVGEYLISAASDTSKDTNYDITIVNTGKLTIQPKEITNPEIVIDNQTFTGKEIKPVVVIKDGDRIIPSNEYIAEFSDNIEPGKAKVTIKDVDGGNYIIQTIETTFNIIDPGIIEVIEPDTPNAVEADFAENPSEIISKIEFTDEEKEAQENGKNIFVFLEVEDISDSVPSADKKLVEDILNMSFEKLGIVNENSDSGSNSKAAGLKVGMYLDISLFKQVEGESKVKVSETSGTIKIAFEIPADLRKDGRTYYIVKVHDGAATLITPSQNGNTLTFETDQFSTYALVYMDKADTPAYVTTPSNNAKSPTTGDMTHTGVVFILMMLSALGVVCLRFIRKRFKGR